MKYKIEVEGGLRTKIEQKVGKRIAAIFKDYPDALEKKLDNFTKYTRRQRITRLLALYEIFKKILSVKGSIVECGVREGFGLMSWAHFSSIIEPINFTRRIYGFDTFCGIPRISPEDRSKYSRLKKGYLYADSYSELTKIIKIYDSNRYLAHINKVQLIKGDASKTIPEFIKNNKHIVISLLFLDFDLFEPTKTAIEYFVPRMPKGAIIAFDELDNPIWPGETLALLETIGINRLKIERIGFDPYIGYAILDNKISNVKNILKR